MQTSSSHISSLAVSDARAGEADLGDRVNYIVVLEDDEERVNTDSNNNNNSNDSASRGVKLRRHRGSNGSCAGSPLTPSANRSGPEELSLHEQQQASPTAEGQLSHIPHLSQPQPQPQPQQQQRFLAISSSPSVTSGKRDFQLSASTGSATAASHESIPQVTRVNYNTTTTGGANADTAGDGIVPRRVAHTLRLQPTLSYAEQHQQQSVDDAPPAKRLRLSLTPTAAATTNPTAVSSSVSRACANATVAVGGRGHVLRLVSPLRTTPIVTAAAAAPPHPLLDTGAPSASPLAEDSKREERALAIERVAQQQPLGEVAIAGNAAINAPAATAVAAAFSTANSSARPAPIFIGPNHTHGNDFSPSAAQPPLPMQQQRQEPSRSSSVATPATATGSPSLAANGVCCGAHTFSRLRSLTPQPYASSGSNQSTPGRRHRFVNVNLPSVAPPPQSELFSTFQRTVRDIYDVHEKLSEGTYGEVFKGTDKRTGALVALKRLKMLSTHQGFPQTSLREVIALRHIQNQRERLEARQRQQGMNSANRKSGTGLANEATDPLAEVAQLCDVLVFDRQQPDIVLVFAYASASLAGLLRRQLVFSPAELAYLIKKLLTAVRKLHEMSIIHRDIKSDNVLITNEGEVQLTDFGLCSIVGSGSVGAAATNTMGGRAWRTPSVITLAYRPPEMLLGSTAYDEKVDIWSVGCLLAQMYLFEPPFYRHRALQQQQQRGQQQQQPQRTAATELEQLSRITEVLGPLPPARVYHPDACQHMRVLEQIEQQGRLAEAGKAAQPANWGKLQSLFEPSFLYQQFHGFRAWFEAEVQRTRSHHHNQPPRRPTQACMDVLCAALQLDPQQRPSAAELLRMPYFTTLDDAPLVGSYHRAAAVVTPEREEEVRRGFMLKVQLCGDSHTQRRPH